MRWGLFGNLIFAIAASCMFCGNPLKHSELVLPIILCWKAAVKNIASSTQPVTCMTKTWSHTFSGTSSNINIYGYLLSLYSDWSITLCFCCCCSLFWPQLVTILLWILVVWCSNEHCRLPCFNSDCCLLVRKLSQDEDFKNGKGSELRGRHIHICSENNFPTAAGLASSAAGYSCLGMLADNLFFLFISLSAPVTKNKLWFSLDIKTMLTKH